VFQVPPHATFSGDIRLTPFYDMADVKAKVERCVCVCCASMWVIIQDAARFNTPKPNQNQQNSYVADLNANITQLPSLGPFSKYEVPEEKVKGKLELTWIGEVSRWELRGVDGGWSDLIE
jgi:acetylornithine deacetylase